MLTSQARRVLAVRQFAAEIKDAAMVRECEEYLARLGVDLSEIDPEPVTADVRTQTKRPSRPRNRTASG